MDHNIFIIGPMGSGKTSVGAEVAASLDWAFVDSDEYIIASRGINAASIAATEGVAALHGVERAFARKHASTGDPVVVAVAASVADDPDLLAEINRSGCLLFHLDVDVALLPDLAAGSDHRRPIAADEVAELYTRRRANAVATGAVCLDRSGGVAAVADRIVQYLATPRSSS